MSVVYAIHADAISELPFEKLEMPGLNVFPSQCFWNDMRCEDSRNESALMSFFQNAEVSLSNSGVYAPFQNANIDYFFHHFCRSRLQIVLMGNQALMNEHNQSIERSLLWLRSDKSQALRKKGIAPASIKIMLHKSGTAFAGLAALQLAILSYLVKISGTKVRKQLLMENIDKLCRKSVNISLVNVKDISKRGKKLLNLNLMQTKGFIVLKMKNDQISIVKSFSDEQEALNFTMSHVGNGHFFNQDLIVSQQQSVEMNQQWQHFMIGLKQKNISITNTLPSLVAMLTFGKSIINFGWVEK